MRLEVLTPAMTRLDVEVARIRAEAPEGHFGLLPRHVDFVSQLVPGILQYVDMDGATHFVAINSGTLVKCGPGVRVAVRGAIMGDDLAVLQRRVETEFRRQDDDERAARAALARLEAGMVRRFRDLGGIAR
jgi:F-type H+-transporting ATPase subunit epsilon